MQRTGNYLADIDVTVLAANQQEVIKTTTQGPLLLARLRPGRYTVAATYEGKTWTRNVTLGDKATTQVAMYFEDPAALGRQDIEPERDSKRR